MASPVLRRWSLVVMKTRFDVSRFVETQLGWVIVFDQILFRIWYITVSFMAATDVWCFTDYLVFVTHTHLHFKDLKVCQFVGII